jgi:thioredoxin-like negative regulator of GroEL
MITLLSDQSFASFTTQHSVVVVLFFAEWDHASKMMQGAFEHFAEHLSASVSFGGVNIDDQAMWPIMSEVGVMTTPTVLIYKDSAIRRKLVGFRIGQRLKEDIQDVLDGSRERLISGHSVKVESDGEPFDWNMVLVCPHIMVHLQPWSLTCSRPLRPSVLQTPVA